MKTTTNAKQKKSEHEPRVRNDLCRHIRSKGMLVNIGERPENDSAQRLLRQADPNTLAWDSTIWWCDETSKSIGPDDRPCHASRCVKGRDCFEAEDDDPAVA